jgi:hypothetical protein
MGNAMEIPHGEMKNEKSGRDFTAASFFIFTTADFFAAPRSAAPGTTTRVTQFPFTIVHKTHRTPGASAHQVGMEHKVILTA